MEAAVRCAEAEPGAQGYEMIQGALVRWSEMSPSVRPPPTAVLVHGILGSRKNMQSFARRLVQVRRVWDQTLDTSPETWHLAGTCSPSRADSSRCVGFRM